MKTCRLPRSALALMRLAKQHCTVRSHACCTSTSKEITDTRAGCSDQWLFSYRLTATMRRRGTEIAPATRHRSHIPTPWRLEAEISPTPDSRISHRHADTPLMRWIPLLRQTATAIAIRCVTIKRLSPPERCAAASETTIV